MFNVSKSNITGFITIKDITDQNNPVLLLEKNNAIHYENFSIALAKSVAHREDGWIHEMVFGNGGATVAGSGVITYLTPNTSGTSASLYSETFSKVIDDNSPLNTDVTKNFMEILHQSNATYTDILITCTLDVGEPSDQASFDTSTETEGQYVFDELGLRSYDATDGTGLLLTHAVFHPVQKSLNRVIEVNYTIRISMC